MKIVYSTTMITTDEASLKRAKAEAKKYGCKIADVSQKEMKLVKAEFNATWQRTQWEGFIKRNCEILQLQFSSELAEIPEKDKDAVYKEASRYLIDKRVTKKEGVLFVDEPIGRSGAIGWIMDADEAKDGYFIRVSFLNSVMRDRWEEEMSSKYICKT